MRRITLLLTLLVFCVLAFAQVRTVTGTVRDAQGKAVPFASVVIKGSTTGTSANEAGNFTIQAAPNSTFVISAAGFQNTELNIGTQTTINAALGGQGNLNEVVVTALGIRRTRNQVPYAAQQVAGEEVSKTRTSNFLQNLSGKVSGLEVRQGNTLGGSTNVVLRGVKTITTSNQALFVIDGVPVDNSQVRSGGQTTGTGGYDYGSAAADINPDDIESITVLKGAASTALYGARGGNGVILITTRKGTRGLGVTVNSGITVGKYDKSTFAKYQKEYGGGYGRFYEDATGFYLARDINGDGVEDLVVPVSEDASYGGAFDPNKLVYQWDAFDPGSPNFGKARPWVAATHDPSSIFETQVSSNQSVFVDGGSDRGTFKLGYTRNDDKGIMPNSKIIKNLLNFGASFNITPRLTANASINFSNISGRGRYGTGYDDKNLMTNFRQWWQVNVDVQDQKTAYFRERNNVTWNWADPTDLVPIYWDNPYFSRYENYETDTRNRFFGIASLNFKATDWLSFLARVSHDTYDEIQEERQAVQSVTTSNYSRNNRSFYETNYDVFANVDKNLSTDFNLKGLLGVNVRKRRNQSIFASSNGGLIIERIYALSNSVSPPLAPAETDAQTQFFSQFGGVTFTWRDMITLDGTLRHDAFSTLPKSNSDAWYPSASLGFTVSKLLPGTAGWLSYAKVRANYARVGNGGETAYLTSDVYNINAPFGSAALVSVTGTKANPNLKIEETESKEIGLEASFLRNRLGFDITYYNAKTFNQIYNVPVSVATGYTSKNLNAGNVRNKGVEISAYGSPVRTNNFSWTINVNWSKNRNKVEELFKDEAGNEIDNIILGSFQGGVTLNATKGLPYGTIRGKDFVYTNGQKTISATSGRYLQTAESNIPIGDVNPDWIGGINNALRYKNLSLSWLIDHREGGDLFSLDMYYGLATGLYPETAGLNDLGNPSRNTVANGGGVILPGVNPDGKINTTRASNTDFGLYGYARQPNKSFVYDAGYTKLREAVLTYSLPTGVIRSLRPFRGIDVSLIGRNLWIIHKNLPYADPEEIISAGNLQGYQVGAYPTVRTFAFNLKLRF